MPGSPPWCTSVQTGFSQDNWSTPVQAFSTCSSSPSPLAHKSRRLLLGVPQQTPPLLVSRPVLGARIFLSGLLYLHNHHEWTKAWGDSFSLVHNPKWHCEPDRALYHMTIHRCLPTIQDFLRILWNETDKDLGRLGQLTVPLLREKETTMIGIQKLSILNISFSDQWIV